MRGRVWVDARKSILSDSTKPVFGFISSASKNVLMVKEQLFSITNRHLLFMPEKGKLMIVD